MKDKFYLTVFIIIAFASLGKAQNTIKIDTIEKEPNVLLVSPLDRLSTNNQVKSTYVMRQKSIFEVKKLPLFCKIEHKLAKSSKINVMMRLGSLDYVNKLEGKN